MNSMEQMQSFAKGLQTQAQMLLDASARGTIKTLTEPHVKEMVESFCQRTQRASHKVESAKSEIESTKYKSRIFK